MTWPLETDQLAKLLDAVPTGVVIVDGAHHILHANRLAEDQLGLVPGSTLDGYVREDDVPRFARVMTQDDARQVVQIESAAGTKTVEAVALPPDRWKRRAIFLSDVSDKAALSRQLKNHRQPSKKLLYQLHSNTTAMMGYAELIDLMLEEEPVVTGDRLNVIRRYHAEVSQGLETLARLLKMERQGGRRPNTSAIPLNRKNIVIIDDEPAITAFIAELMKGLKYRVSAYDDPEAAFSYCRDNTEQIDLLIVDQSLPDSEEGSYLDRLLALPGDYPVVVCAETDVANSESDRTFICHKPIDISDLTRIVADLI